MTFRPLSYKYAVPIPLGLAANASARWVSDVIIMDPLCSWAVPDPPLVVSPEDWNTTSTWSVMVNISLPMQGVGAQAPLSYFGALIV